MNFLLIFCEKKLKIQHKYCPTLIWKAFSTDFVIDAKVQNSTS